MRNEKKTLLIVIGLLVGGLLMAPAAAQSVFSTYIGGSLDERADSVAVDAEGNIYLTGSTSSSDFAGQAPVEPWHGGQDAFIAKLDASGSFLHYVTYVGGSLDDTAMDIAVDSSGIAYITGKTFSTDFPVTVDAFQFQGPQNGDTDSFLAVVDSTGTLLYSTYLGGSDDDRAISIALYPSGGLYPEVTVYIGGSTRSLDFPTTSGAYNETINGYHFDVFITLLNPWASSPNPQLVYSTYIGGASSEVGPYNYFDLDVDAFGAVYFTGSTDLYKNYQPYYPTTGDAYRPTVKVTEGSRVTPGFISKLYPAGNGGDDLVYSTYITEDSKKNNPTGTTGITVDDFGRAYVFGLTDSNFFPTTSGAFDTSFTHDKNVLPEAFIFILNTNVPGTEGLEYSS